MSKLIYLGKFGETLEQGSEQEEMVKEAEMFSIGTHRGVEYTEEDLKTLAEGFSEADEIPVQLDHSESARDTVGYLKEAFVKGSKLMGKLHIIDEYAKERINKGLMKKLSISFYLKQTEEGFKPHKLREVSLVAFPQVKNARLFSENGYVSDYEEKEGGNDMSKVDLQELKTQLAEDIKAELKKQYSDMENELETLRSEKVSFTEKQIEDKIEKFQEDKKTVPAQAEALKQLLNSFSEDQAKLFNEFMDNSQKVDLSEQGEVEQEDGEEKDTRTPEQKEFDEFYEKHTKKFGNTL